MNCGNCTHWTLNGRMSAHGYGQCAARPEQQREAYTTSAQNVCRTGNFAKVDARTLLQRQQEGPLL